MMKKRNCTECKGLPEGEVVEGHDHRSYPRINGKPLDEVEKERFDWLCEKIFNQIRFDAPELGARKHALLAWNVATVLL